MFASGSISTEAEKAAAFVRDCGLLLWDPHVLTLPRFPVPSIRASSPPGPRLLLRLFFAVCFVFAAIAEKEAASIVAFS